MFVLSIGAFYHNGRLIGQKERWSHSHFFTKAFKKESALKRYNKDFFLAVHSIKRWREAIITFRYSILFWIRFEALLNIQFILFLKRQLHTKVNNHLPYFTFRVGTCIYFQVLITAELN